MKPIAFDLGRVIFDFDYKLALDKIKDNLGVSVDRVIEDLFYNDFAKDFEKGLVSGYDFYSKFKRSYYVSLEYSKFMDIWCDIFSPKEDIVELIRHLRIIYPVYLISNINELHFKHLYQKYPWIFSLFDEMVLSFKIKSVKPEKKIYKELSKACRQEYNNIIYIDDREDLIREAKKLNLHCITFKNLHQLTKELSTAGIYIPDNYEENILSFLKNKIFSYGKVSIVGLGNSLRSDDGVGTEIARQLKGKIALNVLDVGASLESYLSKLRDTESDLFLFIDAGEFRGRENFAIFRPEQIVTPPLYFTHNSSLNLALEYLQKENTFDILILSIKAYNHSVGEEISAPVKRAKEIINNFFIRNFPFPSAKE
jgi:putative hydrolase of the HAD superfamily